MSQSECKDDRKQRIVITNYRLLEHGETVIKSDECLNDDCQTWSAVGSLFVGMNYSSIIMVPVRREL